MARQELIVMTDDVTGERGDDIMTVAIIANGVAYECDMGPETREAYATAIQPYLSAARRVGRAAGNNVVSISRGVPQQRSAVANSTAGREQNKSVREWWERNRTKLDLPEVSERGRIPGDVLDAYAKYRGVDIPDTAPLVEAVKERTGKPIPVAKFSEPEPEAKPLTPAKRAAAVSAAKAPSTATQATKATPRKAATAKVTEPVSAARKGRRANAG